MKPIEDLIQAYLDGDITREEFDCLQEALLAERSARELLYQHARLARLIRGENDTVASAGTDVPTPTSLATRPRHGVYALAVRLAAVVALAVGMWFVWTALSESRSIRIAGSPRSSWSIDGLVGNVSVQRGSRVTVDEGIVSLLFPSGTRITGRAPLTLDMEGDRAVRLTNGQAFFDVASDDHGFVVNTARAKFVDLGTRFGVTAGRAAGDELHVVDGKVRLDTSETHPEVAARRAILVSGDAGTPRSIRYEGFRFAADAGSDHSYVHWSFDEPDGALECRAAGTAPGIEGFGGVVISFKDDSARAERPEGRFGNAFRFNGKEYILTAYPGVGGDAPRTVAFWYRDPTATGPLLDEPYHDQPLIMWGHASTSHKRQHWRIKIRRHKSRANRNDKTFRFITTPTGRHRAPGDNRRNWLSTEELPVDNGWHHYASVYSGPLNDDGAGTLKHYIDGEVVDEMALYYPPDTPLSPDGVEGTQPLMIGSFWGPTPNRDGARKEGEIDELFIVHDALTQDEVRRLMRSNGL